MGRAEVVFVTHEATRTGAPMNLLHLVRWVGEHSDTSVAVVALAGGPLLERFAEAAPTRLLGDVEDTWPSKVLASLRLRWAASKARGLTVRWRARPFRDPDLVYLNSLTSLRALRLLGQPRRVVLHVHEMEMAIRLSLRPAEWDELVARTDLFVAASEAVARVLRARGVPEAAIRVHHEFIATDVARSEDAQVAADRAELRIEDGVPVVGGGGVIEWRKAPDLFVALAAELDRRGGTVPAFVWVGGRHEGAMWERVAHDLEAAGLGGRVHFLADRDDPARWFSLFDVFALTSREDPYPLVCLEVGLLGVPTVCFATSGTAELVEPDAGGQGAGRAVAHADVVAMADEVASLLADDERRRALGRAAGDRVRARHDVEVAAPALWADVERVRST